MKKIFKLNLLFILLFTLGGCVSKKTSTEDNKSKTENSKVAIQIKDGTYVLPEDSKTDKEEGYLALNLKLTNKTKNTLDISASDITLYDEEDNKVSQESQIYTDHLKMLESFDSLDGNKNTSGYVLFKVVKNKKYTLHYSPSLDLKKQKPIKINVNPKKYNDPTLDVTHGVENYINVVFLNTKLKNNNEQVKLSNKKTETNSQILSNNLTEEHEQFNKKFATIIKSAFDYYKPSEAEIQSLIDKFEAANAKKAKITYAIKECYPNSATVYVKPETIHFEELDQEALIEEFKNTHTNNYNSTDIDNYNRMLTDAEKYLLEKLPTKFEEASISANDTYSDEGFEVQLSKKDGKWLLNSTNSDKNDEFEELQNAFMGDSNY